MDYSPPPLFKQGASARAKVVIFSLIAIVLLVADARVDALATIRQVVGTVLYPFQRLALMPRDAVFGVGTYFSSLSRLEQENAQFKQRQVANAQTLQQVQLLAAENAQLRKLLGASERLPVKSLMSEILYDARDPFTRKIVLDRGSRHGVAAGQPVIDDAGVVGQITRVFPFTAEATLLTDKEQAIPVQVVRSGLRSIAYGRGQSGVLDLRFLPASADIQKGDLLVTSGIDGVFPAGLAVAKVERVEHKSSDAFARIVCVPAAGIDRNRQLLILLTGTVPPLVGDTESVQPPVATAPAAKDAAAAAKPGAQASSATPATPPKSAPASATPAAAVKPAASQAAAPAARPVAPAAQPGGAVAKPPARPAASNSAPATTSSTVVVTSSTSTVRPATTSTTVARTSTTTLRSVATSTVAATSSTTTLRVPSVQSRPATSPAPAQASPSPTPASSRPVPSAPPLPVELRR